MSDQGNNPTTLSKQGWAEDFLSYIGEPASGPNDPRVTFLEQWESGEGTFQEGNIYDPLDVEAPQGTQGSPAQGWTNTTLEQGEQTTYYTMQANDPSILGQLENPSATESSLSGALAESQWAALNDTSAGEAANEQYGSSYIPSVSPNAGISATSEVPFGGTYQGQPVASGNYSPGASTAESKNTPGWLRTLWNLQQSGTPNQGPGGTFGGTFGGIESTVVKILLDLAIGGMGFAILAGGLIIVFGPSFLRKAGQATGFGQAPSVQVSREASARAAQISREIGEREQRRESARVYRERQQQQFDLQKIQAREAANMRLINARKSARRRASDRPKGPGPKPSGAATVPPRAPRAAEQPEPPTKVS